MNVAKLPDDFYRNWIDARFAAAAAEPAGEPPERWLQQLWRHQRLRRESLVTLDGAKVAVLHPGYWNREPGPDFRGALVKFGENPPMSGDVEIDRQPGGWRAHRHEGNPEYGKVVLRLVWKGRPGAYNPPLMALEPHIDSPWDQLSRWLDDEAPDVTPASAAGRCRGPLAVLGADVARELLEQAGVVRLRRKAAEFAAAARRLGWNGALWIGLFGALGYKHNAWPMRRLGELLCTRGPTPGEAGGERSHWEARLLGLGGFLEHEPAPIARTPRWRTHWDIWWRERDQWGGDILPARAWRLAGLRPANHPRLRLEAAAGWMAAGRLPNQLTAWISETPQPDDFLRVWNAGLAPQPGSARVGEARGNDIAVNVALPWLLARAESGPSRAVAPEVLRRYLAWPAGQDNAALRFARQRLLGSAAPLKPVTAAIQQGLIQVTRDFCDRAGPLCDDCRFGDLVRAAASKVVRPS
jgi:Protein of unknown function (DUF2851)